MDQSLGLYTSITLLRIKTLPFYFRIYAKFEIRMAGGALRRDSPSTCYAADVRRAAALNDRLPLPPPAARVITRTVQIVTHNWGHVAGSREIKFRKWNAVLFLARTGCVTLRGAKLNRRIKIK